MTATRRPRHVDRKPAPPRPSHAALALRYREWQRLALERGDRRAAWEWGVRAGEHEGK